MEKENHYNNLLLKYYRVQQQLGDRIVSSINLEAAYHLLAGALFRGGRIGF